MPKPEKHVFVCTMSRPQGHPRGSCGEKGCMAVMEGFLAELQQRALFDKIAITNTGCLGPCGVGPNVLVYPDGVMYNNVGVDDIAVIFDEHLVGGKPVERLLAPEEVWG